MELKDFKIGWTKAVEPGKQAASGRMYKLPRQSLRGVETGRAGADGNKGGNKPQRDRRAPKSPEKNCCVEERKEDSTAVTIPGIPMGMFFQWMWRNGEMLLCYKQAYCQRLQQSVWGMQPAATSPSAVSAGAGQWAGRCCSSGTAGSRHSCESPSEPAVRRHMELTAPGDRHAQTRFTARKS